MDALTTNQLQVERRESHRAYQVVYAHPTSATGGEEERDIEPIKCMRSPHTSYRCRGERIIEPIKCMRSPHYQLQVERRESHRANQVLCVHHTPATGGEERES